MVQIPYGRLQTVTDVTDWLIILQTEKKALKSYVSNYWIFSYAYRFVLPNYFIEN